MNIIRKTLGALFVILGTYYCILSVLTLATLPSVTTRWVQRSADPDFKYDYGTFMVWIAVGAVVVGAFGYRTAVKGIMAARARRESWLALAIGAPLLHSVWFLYRTIGNGVLDREGQQIAMRNNGVWFGAICLAYVAMHVAMRQGDSARRSPNTNMQPTPATGQ
jgi:multisubunit Na+/H+ antiporter MnhG subunit